MNPPFPIAVFGEPNESFRARLPYLSRLPDLLATLHHHERRGTQTMRLFLYFGGFLIDDLQFFCMLDAMQCAWGRAIFDFVSALLRDPPSMCGYIPDTDRLHLTSQPTL